LASRRIIDPVEIATRLAPGIHWPEARFSGQRSWRLAALTPDFDAWVIAWPSGSQVDLHDHGRSSGAVVVLEGALVETTPQRNDSGRLEMERHELRKGMTQRLGPGHIHDVSNEADAITLSLHVYHPPLVTMTNYDLGDNQLVRRKTLQVLKRGTYTTPGSTEMWPLESVGQ
jgi:hypothetical protein